ncbi:MULTISPECIES: YigZ family protein [unclassified Halanaerobium]|uniref:IMPACT family protein n=1 Tax=unclassified Halanaerobium TaxID=2641197 RepID=UPI000DF2F4C6|nr:MULTISPECIES: YigZ family protein [unclassified Halanaerobium]RCW43797.1 putative YigZ family protein [Halanaerobium sp. MA284_MarDTE_T2]RCW80221.1 putative YigZ family protein [Halanaerobium sp. DL-01]
MSEKKLKPAKNLEIRNKVKDSKFYASIFSVNNRSEAEEKIEEIKNKYSDASHNVSAFRVESESGIIEYFDDDGEPAGSSGPPVLDAIKGADLINTVIVVTRYFGGTKLGIGGLIRAYGNSARMAINEAGIEELNKFFLFSVESDFNQIGNILGQLEAHKAEILNTFYNEKGGTVKSIISSEDYEHLQRDIREKTGDKFSLKLEKTLFR